MKYLLLITLSALVLNAGAWSTISGMALKEIKPKASYTIDTAGYNPRVYEFDTTDGRHCVAIFGNDKAAVAMQCYKK